MTKRNSNRKANLNKYIRISERAGSDKFKEMGEKVQKGLYKQAYCAIDNNILYYYYLKLK